MIYTDFTFHIEEKKNKKIVEIFLIIMNDISIKIGFV